MGRQRRRHPALEGIDADALAEFRAGLRRRYTDEEILAELRASAARLGRSPTMREFAADPEATVHPQTVIEHFGTWNNAKRAAGLTARRFISRDEMVQQLQQLGKHQRGAPGVGIGQCGAPHAAHVQVIVMTAVQVQPRLEFTQAARATELHVHHGQQLLPAAKALGVAVRPVSGHDAIEGASRHGLEHLLDSAYAEHVAAMWSL